MNQLPGNAVVADYRAHIPKFLNVQMPIVFNLFPPMFVGERNKS